jgi:tetratricopeptide (TPR) repeat protein
MHPILLTVLACIVVIVASTIFPGFTSQIAGIAALLVFSHSLKYKNEQAEVIIKAYDRGIIHYNEGNYDQAIRYFSLIINETFQRPNDCGYIAMSYHARAGCHHCLENFISAIDDYDQSIKLDPVNSTYFINRGITYTCMTEYAKAVEDHNIAIKLEADNANAFFHRGQAFLYMNEYTKALNDYNQAIIFNPGDANFYCGRAAIYSHINQNLEAINDYTQAIRLESGCINAYAGRGYIYLYGVKYVAAIQDFTLAIQLNMSDSYSYVCRGMANCYTGEHQKAIDDFSEATRLQPSVNNYYNLAVTQHFVCLMDESLSNVNQALTTLDVNFAGAYYLRSNLLAQLNDLQGAVKDFQQAKKVEDSHANETDSGDVHGFYHRGLAKYRMGDQEGAISDLEKAMQICLKIQYFTFHQYLSHTLLEIKESLEE